MVGPGIGVPVRDQHRESISIHETQRRHLMHPNAGTGGVGQEHAAQIRGDGLGIIQFDEIIREQHETLGQPLVDLHVMRVGRRLCNVRPAESRPHQTPRAVRQPPNRVIGRLESKHNRVAHRPVRIEQPYAIAVLIQTKPDVVRPGIVIGI